MEDQGSSKFVAGVGKVVELVKTSKDFIGSALQSCPAASLAWAGVCLLVLPVSHTNSTPRIRDISYDRYSLGYCQRI